MSTPTIVIVGASIAGLTAAETLRQEGFDGDVTLVGAEQRLPYTRPPLSKQILSGAWEPADAAIRTADELDELDIRLHTGRAAVGVDIGRRVLFTSDGPLPFDELIIATGTESRVHPALPDAPTLRNMDDALRLRAGMRAARRIAVVGSGILGSEIASAARAHDTETTLLGRSGSLSFGGAGSLLTDRLRRLHSEHGVELALGAQIVRSSSTPLGGTRLEFADGGARTFDLVACMIGGEPCTRWLSGSGLDIRDGVACDVSGTAAPGVSAVGDVAAWFDPVSRRHVRVEHQSHAIEQAVAVAIRLVRNDHAAPPVPLFWSELHGTRITAYGWFPPHHRLSESAASSGGNGVVLTVHDDDGAVRGVIGWNAAPRDFRAARAAVLLPAPPLVTGSHGGP